MMIVEAAFLLLGILVGFLGSCIFNVVMTILDKKTKISQLWRLLTYFGGTGGVPPIIAFLVEYLLSISIISWVSYYIVGLVATFLFNAIAFYIYSKQEGFHKQ